MVDATPGRAVSCDIERQTMANIFILIDEQPVGPFQEDRVYRMIREGKIGRQAFMRFEGDEVWRPANELLKGLSSGLPASVRLVVVAGLISIFILCPTSIGLSIYWGFREVAVKIGALVTALENVDEVGADFFQAFQGIAQNFITEVDETISNPDWVSGFQPPTGDLTEALFFDSLTADGRSVTIIESWTQDRVGYQLFGNFIGVDGESSVTVEPITYLIVDIERANNSREIWDFDLMEIKLQVEPDEPITPHRSAMTYVNFSGENQFDQRNAIRPGDRVKSRLIFMIPVSWIEREGVLIVPDSFLKASE